MNSSPKSLFFIGVFSLFAIPSVSAQQSEFVFEWEIAGADLGDGFGHAVSGIGDVDADGTPDFLVGAPYADPNGIFAAGSVYLYSGSSGTIIRQWDGTTTSEWFGFRVACVHDLDADNIADVMISSVGASPGGLFQAGSVSIYSSAGGGLIHKLDGTSILQGFGYSIAKVGDFDSDGIHDFFIGAPFADANGLQDCGAAFLHSGATGLLIAQFEGEFDYDQFGTSVADAGDVDHDGTSDLIIGAPSADPEGRLGAGSAYVYSGASLASLHRFDGNSEWDDFGCAVSTVRDVNRDGHDDVIIGARRTFKSGIYDGAGSAYVYSGRTTDLIYRHEGTYGREWLGSTVAEAGDVNGDGFPDYLVGVPGKWFITAAYDGGAHIYSGSTGEILLEQSSKIGVAGLGTSVAGVGDLNGDGKDDVIIGAPNPVSINILNEGDIYLLSIAQSLTASAHVISASNGGQIDFTIDLPVESAGYSYHLLGSASGRGPWVQYGKEIPLSRDRLTQAMYPSPLPNFQNSSGFLDSNGDAIASAGFAPNQLAPYVGKSFWFAAVTWQAGEGLAAVTINVGVEVQP